MRAWTLFLAGLLVFALLVAFYEPLRSRALNVLTGKPQTAAGPAAPAATPGIPASVPQPEPAPSEVAAEPAQVPPAEEASATPAATPPERVAQEPALPAQAAAAPPVKPGEAAAPPAAPAQSPAPPQALPQPAPAAQPAQVPVRIEAPPLLASVSFGMSPGQIQALYPIAWQRQEANELMLVNYPVPDKSQMLRFHLGSSGLFLIELRIKPPQNQPLQGLYDQLQAQCSQKYGGVQDTSVTRWSDGVTAAAIQRVDDSVEISYKAMPAP